MTPAMQAPPKRRPILALASLVLALTVYALLFGLFVVSRLAHRFEFYGVDLFLCSACIIVIAPIVGFGLGLLAVSEYRKSGWTEWERGLSIGALVLSSFNWLLVIYLWWKLH